MIKSGQFRPNKINSIGLISCDVRSIPVQIRCGDLYADKAIESFTACAVSDKKCVPQRVDIDKFPIPKDQYLDEDFDLNKFQVQTASHASERIQSNGCHPCL